ncbi:MAG: Omp28-related outer membrane protein [Prevotellaceae bacterium]|jgi:hypothetical protein|nr:Omp28-related outer membrane protein [Prevotellaceae bacterium]
MKNLSKIILFATAILFFACKPPEVEHPLSSDPVQRTILIEEFTGDQCVYCPWGADAISASIEGNENKAIVVCHHVGYNEDKYTISKSRPLTFFYGGTTFAPACMIDRTIIPEVDDEDVSPVFFPSYLPQPKLKASIINKMIEVPSYVTVNIKHSFNAATRELIVDISGELRQDYPNARINVYIIQEELVGQQVGPVNQTTGEYVPSQNASSTTVGGTIQNYSHKHVVRAALAETAWGDILDVTKGKYSKSYAYEIPTSIKGVKGVEIPADVSQMYIVAFVADYIKNSKDNLDKSKVHNAAIKKIVE